MDLEQQEEEIDMMEGFKQLVGYKAESSEQQGFFLQFSQSFEGCAKENQENMILTYWD